jgi:hypothetical protein
MQDAYTPALKRVSQEQIFLNGNAVDVVRIEYTVGVHGPFVERLPKGEFDAAKVQALMQATAAQLRALGATQVV